MRCAARRDDKARAARGTPVKRIRGQDRARYTPLQVLKWNRLYDLMERAPGHLNAVRRVTR
jgi:hypothetical protein